MRLVLKGSGITKEDVTANPNAALDVLNFHMKGGAESIKPQVQPVKTMPTEQDSKQEIAEAAETKKEVRMMSNSIIYDNSVSSSLTHRFTFQCLHLGLQGKIFWHETIGVWSWRCGIFCH